MAGMTTNEQNGTPAARGTLGFALLVFAGGASYGIMGPLIKLVYAAGFTWQQAVASQATFAVILFGLVWLFQILRGSKPAPISKAGIAKLLGVGATSCATTVLYSIALSLLPVAVAITLLFQFTWVGIVIQAITTGKAPNKAQVISAVLIVVGTVFASGFLSSELAATFSPVGIACGLGSSITVALFMHFSGRVEVGLPPIQRGFVVCLGAMILGLVVCPTFIVAGTVIDIAPFGIWQGFFALFLPVILFGIGTPHLPTGISTVLASSELPCSIVLTFLLLGEGVDALQIAGVATILLGVVVSQSPELRAAWEKQRG